MKKIVLGQEIELTEHEQRIYKKGREDGIAEGGAVIIGFLFIILIIVGFATGWKS